MTLNPSPATITGGCHETRGQLEIFCRRQRVPFLVSTESREKSAPKCLRSHANYWQNSGIVSPSARLPRPGTTALAGACGEKAAGSFQIARGLFLPSQRQSAGDWSSPSHPHHFCSFQSRPTHNSSGKCSERNKTIPVRVGNDADLRAGRAGQLSLERPALRFFEHMVGLGARHSSLRSPGLPVVVTFGVCTSEHESKEFPDDGNLTAQRIKLTARGGNAKG